MPAVPECSGKSGNSKFSDAYVFPSQVSKSHYFPTKALTLVEQTFQVSEFNLRWHSNVNQVLGLIFIFLFFSSFSRWEILCMLSRRLSLFAWNRGFITLDLFISFLQCFHNPQEQPSNCTVLIIRNSYSFQMLGTLYLSGNPLPSQFTTKGSLTTIPLHSQTLSWLHLPPVMCPYSPIGDSSKTGL